MGDGALYGRLIGRERASNGGQRIDFAPAIRAPTAENPDPQPRRNFSFPTTAELSGDIRLSKHFAVRGSVEQMLIRYKSTVRDPPGIGKPPRLSFLSHDNYINSTNWGVSVGPVFRF